MRTKNDTETPAEAADGILQVADGDMGTYATQNFLVTEHCVVKSRVEHPIVRFRLRSPISANWLTFHVNSNNSSTCSDYLRYQRIVIPTPAKARSYQPMKHAIHSVSDEAYDISQPVRCQSPLHRK